MNSKNLLIFSVLFTAIVIALGCTGFGGNTNNNTQTPPPITNEFVLTDANFDFVAVAYTNPGGSDSDYANTVSSLNLACNNYKAGLNGSGPLQTAEWATNMYFFVMYNLKDVPSKYLDSVTHALIKPMPCTLTIDGKTYSHLDSYEVGVINLNSYNFCDPAVMSTQYQICVEPATHPTANFTVSHDVTLCCGDICKTKTLPAFCK